MFDAVGKTGSWAEAAATETTSPNPFSAAKSVVWMTASPRVLAVRRSHPGGHEIITEVPCGVTGRGADGRWVVESRDEIDHPGADRAARAALVRCIFASPFRAASLVALWLPRCDRAALRLAWEAYDMRRLPEGHPDTTRLAVVADALEEAGCDDAGLLAHLRGPGPHVRGCWALDLILGKS